MNRSLRKSFRRKPKGLKQATTAPLWEETLAHLNALMKKNPHTDDEQKMNVLVSAMIELQQEYRASVVQCEKLKNKVAELTQVVHDKDQQLQERSLQIEAAHFRISGLTYLERSELQDDGGQDEEEEKKSDYEDEQSGSAENDLFPSEVNHNNTDKQAGEVRRPPPRPEATIKGLDGNNIRENRNGFYNHNNKRGTGASHMGMMAKNATPWQPPCFVSSSVQPRVNLPSDTDGLSGSIPSNAATKLVEIVETLEI